MNEELENDWSSLPADVRVWAKEKFVQEFLTSPEHNDHE